MDATIVPEVQKHYPVLLKEIISIISPQYGGTFIDCTFGQGGYSKKILEFENTKVIALDRDIESETKANLLKNKFEDRFIFKNIKFIDSQKDSFTLSNKKLLKKIGGISEDKNMVASEDYNTWLRIAAVTERFKYVPKSLGCYQVHSNGISQRDMSKSNYAAIAEFKDQLTPDQLCETEKLLSYLSGRFNYLKKGRIKKMLHKNELIMIDGAHEQADAIKLYNYLKIL